MKIKILIAALVISKLSWADILMSQLEKNRIDEIALMADEHGSMALQKKHKEILSFMEQNYVGKYNLNRKIISLYEEEIKGQENFVSLFVLSHLTAAALSEGFERQRHSHPAHKIASQEVENLIKTKDVKDIYLAKKQALPEWFFCFKPLVLLGNEAHFSEQGYLYALSKNVYMFALVDKVRNDLHLGLFSSPLEIFLHDIYHGNDIFLKEDLNKAQWMISGLKTFCQDLVASELWNTSQEAQANYILLFAIAHESAVTIWPSKNALATYETLLKIFIDNFIAAMKRALFISNITMEDKIVMADLFSLLKTKRNEKVEPAKSALLAWDPAWLIAQYEQETAELFAKLRHDLNLNKPLFLNPKLAEPIFLLDEWDDFGIEEETISWCSLL